jgi:hypothetical protein
MHGIIYIDPIIKLAFMQGPAILVMLLQPWKAEPEKSVRIYASRRRE